MSDEFQPARMKPAQVALHETLERMAQEAGGEWKAVFDDWCELWARPHDYARGALAGSLSPEALVFFHLGVAFGIDYEQAYPEGREDEWPVPVEERAPEYAYVGPGNGAYQKVTQRDQEPTDDN